MDRLRLLQSRKQKLLSVSKQIRDEIAQIIDPDSFVELSAFSFSKNDFYGEDAEGEGVVTGFATINDYPFYIVAQNANVFSGGVSKANCEKIEKCMDQAEKNQTPIIYILSSLGVMVGEGVNVLEGLASLIFKASRLKGVVPQYLIVNGDVYGQISVLAGICDFTFFFDKKSVLCANSPLVVSAAGGVNLNKTDVGGINALRKTNLVSFGVNGFEEVRNKIIKLTNYISVPVIDCDELNEPIAELDKKAEFKNLLKVFDNGELLEIGESFCPEVKCLIGRVGGITVASVIFRSGDGVELNVQNVRKLKDFANFARNFDLPYLTFVNTAGIKADLNTNDSLVLKEIGEYVYVLDSMVLAKISVTYGKAIGLGYTLFAAKSAGYDYTYAFANSEIALFNGAQGAEIEFGHEKADKNKLADKYSAENSDPINAAKGGYIDNIIQPSFVKQYLIASLQMLMR